ncbi:hypothetical protein [Lentzea xinjiangensis]|nr:hypothetical protein [Lentzea xinjiangensis]
MAVERAGAGNGLAYVASTCGEWQNAWAGVGVWMDMFRVSAG